MKDREIIIRDGEILKKYSPWWAQSIAQLLSLVYTFSSAGLLLLLLLLLLLSSTYYITERERDLRETFIELSRDEPLHGALWRFKNKQTEKAEDLVLFLLNKHTRSSLCINLLGVLIATTKQQKSSLSLSISTYSHKYKRKSSKALLFLLLLF